MASPDAEAVPAGEPYLVGRVGSVRCGLDLRRVREVVRAGSPSRVPGSRPPLRGLKSVRGEVVMAVELAVGPRIAAAAPPWLVVLRGEGDLVGVLLDSVEDILDLPAPGARESGAEGVGIPEAYLSGVTADEHGPVAVLDPEVLRVRAVAAAEPAADTDRPEVQNVG